MGEFIQSTIGLILKDDVPDYWQIVSNKTHEQQRTRSECADPYIYHIFSFVPFFIGKITLYLHVFDSLK